MLIKNKKNFIYSISLAIIAFAITLSALANDKGPLSQEQLIAQVEQLFLQDPEALNHSNVKKLSQHIINTQKNFPNDIIAKTYYLLANVASNKGELETAFQFTQDGLAIPSMNERTKLCLQLKLAAIYSSQKHYPNLLKISERAIRSEQAKINTKYLLIALSYRSVANAMLDNHTKAFADLQQIEIIVKQNPAFAEHVSLLTILASVYFYLEDYQTALTVQLKILTLRFNLNKLHNVGQTYYHLANAYYRLNRFDDAYNAYWEAKKYSEKNMTPIYLAYAYQGIGLTLMQQKKHLAARAEFVQAKNLFFQHKLPIPQVETLISLAQVSQFLMKEDESFKFLLTAEHLLNGKPLSKDYIIFYQLLAEYYLNQEKIERALFWQTQYSIALFNLHQSPPTHIDSTKKDQTRNLALKLAQQSELNTSYTRKYQVQQVTIIALSSVLALILILLLAKKLKRRAKKLTTVYDELESPNYVLINSRQTKALYQLTFNMARKYNYPLTLAYISIENWQELLFKFNKKTVKEVNKGIISLINGNLNEFESAGLINDGEYLLLFPHQNEAEVALTMQGLVEALKVRFFANLGSFSVTISYSVKSPNFQDIDPYVFLSQLSESVKVI